MPSKIDQNLIPPVIRESVDPDILNRAQSIEWSINRDTGEDEHGYLDGQNGYHNLSPSARKSRKIEWCDSGQGRDSGFEYTPTSPSLGAPPYDGYDLQKYGHSMRSLSSLSGSDNGGQQQQQRIDLSPLDDFGAGNTVSGVGTMKRHPQGQYPFPIYKVNQEQLEGDVVFDPAPRGKAGERTVHYEKASRVLNEEDLDALGLDPKFFGSNSKTMMDEQEEELIETSVLKGGSKELEDIYNSMRVDTTGYFDRQRARSVSPVGNRNPIESEHSEHKKTIIFGSVDEINNKEQEFYPYRDAHQGKVSDQIA